jgi:uncharacterized protein
MMIAIATPFVAGLVFGLGLLVSQMVNPAKIFGFLDFFGAWDPSLMLVMATAIPVAALGFALAPRRQRPVIAASFRLPRPGPVDGSVLAGAALFGIGWGLVGLCPGPAIVDLGFGLAPAALFVVAMLVGMGLYELVQSLRARPSTSEA